MPNPPETFPTPLIGAPELARCLLRRPPPVVLDAGFELTDPLSGEAAYRAAHVPGALYAHLDRDLSGPKSDGGRFRGRHPLPDPTVFAAALGRLGITPASDVVVLDRQGGMMAARAWWLLRWIGHRSVAVLDGGMSAWLAAGGAVESGDVTAVRAPLYPLPGEPGGAAGFGMATVDPGSLLARLGQVVLLDARAPERFRGEVEPLDAAAGHIPGARNRFFKDNLDADGRFKPAAVLRAEYDALLATRSADQVVQSCGSGVTACHNLLAMEMAGLAGSVLYPGSWSEWSSDLARPVARG